MEVRGQKTKKEGRRKEQILPPEHTCSEMVGLWTDSGMAGGQVLLDPPPPGRRSKLTGVYMSHKLLPVMMMPPYSLNHFSTLPDKEERHVRYFAWHNYQRFFIEEDLT